MERDCAHRHAGWPECKAEAGPGLREALHCCTLLRPTASVEQTQMLLMLPFPTPTPSEALLAACTPGTTDFRPRRPPPSLAVPTATPARQPRQPSCPQTYIPWPPRVPPPPPTWIGHRPAPKSTLSTHFQRRPTGSPPPPTITTRPSARHPLATDHTDQHSRHDPWRLTPGAHSVRARCANVHAAPGAHTALALSGLCRRAPRPLPRDSLNPPS